MGVAEVSSFVYRTSNKMRPFQRVLYSTNNVLNRTNLYDYHLRKSAKMLNFCGWNMPLHYSSPSAEHDAVRSFLGVFDVSHMRQVVLQGNDVIKLLDYATLAHVRNMKSGSCQYTVMLNEDAGIIDDLILTKDSNETFYAVLNCCQAEKDIAHLREIADHSKLNIDIEELNTTLLAIQGPESMDCLQRGFDIKLNRMKFMDSISPIKAFGIPNCRISRVGYTGEDGFELMVPNDCAEFAVMQILNFTKGPNRGVLAGLSARDSLRIEAGLCLYGNELSESVNIKEAGLLWLLNKKKIFEKSFKGYSKMKEILETPNDRVRVGLTHDLRTPLMRAGTDVLDANENPIGKVTSSCVGRKVHANLAMAYINANSTRDQMVLFRVRGKQYEAKITKMPFVQPKYYSVVA